jgi:uncharacterized protein (UPF0276 family)
MGQKLHKLYDSLSYPPKILFIMSNINFAHSSLAQATAGISLLEAHHTSFLTEKQPVAWVEILAEDFLNPHVPAFARLERIRQNYPISIHGVNLSLGSSDGIDENHVLRVKDLIDRIEPFLISDQLSWARFSGRYFSSGIPLPYTQEALNICHTNLERIQNIFGRPLLVQNPSTCIQYHDSSMSEADFLTTLVNRAGAGILLDLNSLYISCANHGWNAHTYIKTLPNRKIQEMKLSGCRLQDSVYIKDYSCSISSEVWQLYKKTLDIIKPAHTTVECQHYTPDLSILLTEAAKANVMLDEATLPGTERANHVSFG